MKDFFKNYLRSVVYVTVSFVSIIAMCYIWEMMPWYTATDETFDAIICIGGAALIITIVGHIIMNVQSFVSNYEIKIVRKEELIEKPEEK